MASICFVAGDPSGDAHAARLVEVLNAKRPDLTYTGLGGPAMRQAGVALLDELTSAASIGPFDAARHLARFSRARRRLDAHLRAERPELVVLVDFGDFNLPIIAPLVKRHHLPIYYFISPQLWAWGRFRLRYIQRFVDHMLVFFKFEEQFYALHGVPVTWVGHPLIDAAQPTMTATEAAARFGLTPGRTTVGLLPGSREDEVRRHLPLLLASAKRIARAMPQTQFLLPKAPGLSPESLARHTQRIGASQIALCVADGKTADALRCMDAAIVTSGTATLETALAGVPMAVIYRTSWPTYLAARAVVRIPHIALVNVVAGEPIVREFLQHRARPAPIADELLGLLRDAGKRTAMQEALAGVARKLGPPGAIDRAASIIIGRIGWPPGVT